MKNGSKVISKNKTKTLIKSSVKCGVQLRKESEGFGPRDRSNWELLTVLEQKSGSVNKELQGFMAHVSETKKTLPFPSVSPVSCNMSLAVPLFSNKGDEISKLEKKWLLGLLIQLPSELDVVFAPHHSAWT